jgi:diaminohydroxyphosphoribosylaminopyrimidine deaminase / 5-amino-6-(5-phosphoribosylamino)uracil reductase
LVDAVIVGAGTVERDDPRLTVRKVEGRNPVRVVLDPEGRLRADHRLFVDGAARTLIVGRAESPPPGKGVEVVDLPVVPGEGFEPAAVLRALKARGLRRVLVEGGGITVSRFLEAGALHRLHIAVAPLLIGSGRPALTLSPITKLENALRPRCRHFRLGEDVLFDLELR